MYNRDIDDLEEQAILWWPENLNQKNSAISIIPNLVKTQDDFLRILSLSKNDPYHFFDILEASKFQVNFFLKHLCVLADYGGEPIQRLGRSFKDIFSVDGEYRIDYSWNEEKFSYTFETLPVKGLSNKKLFIDGDGLLTNQKISGLYKDMIILLMFGSTSTVSDEAALSSCEIGTLLGKPEALEKYVRERYLYVSRITGGATANKLGQLAQQEVVQFLSSALGDTYNVRSNGSIELKGYAKAGGMPFDIVVEKNKKMVGIEISFQVTTNSTIERKSGQAADRMHLMHDNGHEIGYVLDGAGNFQRRAALSTICENSDCTVAYTHKEFEVLARWIGEALD